MRWARYLFLLLLPGVPLMQLRIDRALGGFRAQEEALYLWKGEHVRRLSPGLESFMADVYWLRTIQYFGGTRVYAKDKRFDLLRPLIDITVTLDPRLEIAYRYGAIFLSEPWPAGAGRPEDGIALLARGARAMPLDWRLRQQEGYFYFLFLKDPRKASQVLLEARRIPGAPYWLETLAADLLAKGGEREVSRRIWRRMYEQGEEGAMKNNALFHLEYMDAQDTRDLLNRAVQEFAQSNGRLPGGLGELPALKSGRRVPVDASGVPFDYDPVTGRVSIGRPSKFWKASEQ